ncbi:MAG: 50S ribosomal subunit protein L13 [Candidatus Westeberhardia cardiocondylae]|nr:50S ribosomal subunit protein L13 [Candidatus Westeberhardia cardiocondylae]
MPIKHTHNIKTYTTKQQIKKTWYCIDASGKTLGRLSTTLAYYLQGKHKIKYTPHIDTGDYIIILNAKKIIVSGKKYKNKIYYHHSGYAGGLKTQTFQDIINKQPEKIIKMAVQGMLPKGTLGKNMIKKLKIYPGNTHKHNTQQPKIIKT